MYHCVEIDDDTLVFVDAFYAKDFAEKSGGRYFTVENKLSLDQKIAAAESKGLSSGNVSVQSVSLEDRVKTACEVLETALAAADEMEAGGHDIHPSIGNRLNTARLITSEVLEDLEKQTPHRFLANER